MTLINKIKGEQVNARKLKEQLVSSLLTTLLGEALMVGKNDGNRDSTDAEVIAVIKKFIKNIDETVSVLDPTSSAFEKASKEKEILTTYLPKQLTEVELEDLVKDMVSSGVTQMGLIMKSLKEKHDGMYDGKVASMVVKKVLGG